MKIKKLVALALASTMVFSMAACGDKKSDAKSSNETVEKVVEAFGEFVKEQDSDFSYDSNMTMKMEGNGQTVTMEMAGTSVSYDGVTYTKSTTKTIMDKESQEVVEESYDIKKEDGSLISATKTSLDEEWDVEEYDAEDVETSEDEMDDFDVEAIKKDAKIETKGDNAIVTMEIAADQVGMDADELMGDMEGFSIKAIVTYNTKDAAITDVEFVFDLKALDEMFGALGVKVSECTMKMNNIKKTDKAIEIPEEIELD